MIRLLLIVLLLLPGLALSAQQRLVLGVSAWMDTGNIHEDFQPLADYLGQSLGDVQVELQVLDEAGMNQAVANHQLDMVFTNPSHYILLRSESALTGALATVVRLVDGEPTSALGGVILVRSDDQHLLRLQDLRGRRIAHAGSGFLGGYQAQLWEARRQGVDLRRDASLLARGDHLQAVRALLAGEVDAAFALTGVLEYMVASGEVQDGQLRVLNRQPLPGYPWQTSTRLYPEWPFLALPHVDQQQVRRIASALLGLDWQHPAAARAGIDGFAPPADYMAVEQVARDLRLPPYDVLPEFTLADTWQRYHNLMLGFALLLVLLLLALAGLLRQLLVIRRGQQQLAHERQRLEEVIWGTDSGIWELDMLSHQVLCNERWASMLGYRLEQLQPVTFATWESLVHPDDLPEAMLHLRQHLGGSSERFEAELRMRHQNGHWVWILSRGRVVERDEQGRPLRMSGTHQDIMAMKTHQLKLEHGAHHDALTGLPNRLLLDDRLRHALSTAHRNADWLAVVYLDLDGFKAVNDHHGHACGDELLVELARRMQAALRESDTLARIGGDEFVALLVGLHGPEDATPVLERLLEAAARPAELQQQRLQVSVSMGVAFQPPGEAQASAEQLLLQADQAMYQAKSAGRNCWRVAERESW